MLETSDDKEVEVSKPNIVFFFTDDQRFDTINALGNSAIRTPNMDRLVRRGVSFTDAHIPGGTDGAVCMPSRAMLLTGRSLFHIERCGESIPRNHTILGEALREAGYQTFGAGKWHNGEESFNRCFSNGDEIFFGGMADHWNVPANRYDPSGRYASRLPICVNALESNALTLRQADHVTAGLHSSDMVCDVVCNFLKEREEEIPFFAYASFLAPHDPRTMPEKYREMYSPEEIELPPNFSGGHPFDTGALHIRDEMLAELPRTPEETRRHIAEYYAMITHLDDCLGRIVETLEEQGVLDNTIIVFAGDNGLALGQHGLFGKQNCYEHSVRVPLIFSGPGIPENVRSDASVYLFDIFPTLCDLTGVPTPKTVEGVSLAPAFNNPDANVRDALLFAYTDCQRAIKVGRYKLIEYAIPDRNRVTQLFDLEEDPWETENLADRLEYAETVADLRATLLRTSQEWDDQESFWGKSFWGRCQL